MQRGADLKTRPERALPPGCAQEGCALGGARIGRGSAAPAGAPQLLRAHCEVAGKCVCVWGGDVTQTDDPWRN